MIRHFRPFALLALSLAVAGCIDTSGPGDPTPIEETTFASSLGVDLNASTRTVNGAYYRDITVGTGQVVQNGQTLQVRYSGWLSSGFLFDSNLAEASPLPFVLGNDNIIAGWHETIPGMRIGGKRQLIIPSTLAYGPYGSGEIPGNAVIVFTVEVVGAQ